jgi:hypothetical protein
MSADVEDTVRRSILDELQRQAGNSEGALRVVASSDKVEINGSVDLDELVMVVMGSLAGGP